MTILKPIQVNVIADKRRRDGFRQRKPSLSREYFYFVLATVVAVLCLSGGFSVFVYMAEQKQKREQLFKDALHIERIVMEGLDYTEGMSALLGRRIATHGTPDPEFIADLFRQTTLPDLDPRNIFHGACLIG